MTAGRRLIRSIVSVIILVLLAGMYTAAAQGSGKESGVNGPVIQPAADSAKLGQTPRTSTELPPPDAASKLALVIDDFGNGMNGTTEMFELAVPFTAAVMPFMPTTRADAEAAHARGLDVIIHMPMEPVKGKRSWLGPNAITTDLSDSEIRSRIEQAIADVPHAIGMNNHMGSRATADERVMRVILETCRDHGLFFLDSRTTVHSVIPKLGRELGVTVIERNGVFLDEVYSTDHIIRQLQKLVKQVELQQASVAIGHVGPPGPKTAAALKAHIPQLQQRARFVRLSELVNQPDPLFDGPAV